MSERQANNRAKSLPNLVPTGSVNKVLLVGGKNLTLFQSVGPLVFAVLGLGVGTAMLRIDGVWFVLGIRYVALGTGNAVQWLQGSHKGNSKKR